MSADLAGRCAVITRAGGGLGRAFAVGFAAGVPAWWQLTLTTQQRRAPATRLCTGG
jgi:NAD(P)-dependent dehydrogenase (short-subunit alcohol dehydrogenase family)